MLTQLTTKNKQNNIYWAFDTETGDNGEFIFGCVYNPLKDNHIIFNDAKKMADFLTQDIKKIKGKGINYMAAFNVCYDLNALHPYYTEKRGMWAGRYIFNIVNNLRDNINEYKLIHDKTELTKAEIDKLKYKTLSERNNRFKIMDLCNFTNVGTSLKQLADSYNIEYLDIHDYKHKRIVEACKTHAKATSLILQEMQKTIREVGGQMKLTAGSTALDTFRRSFLEDKFIITDEADKPEVQHKLEQFLTYKGGITEVFNYSKQQRVNYIDVNSMYPYIMKNISIPNMNRCSPILDKMTGKQLIINVNEWNNKLNNYMWEGFAFIKISIPSNVYYHPFYNTIDKKLIALNGIQDIHLTFPEIRKLLKLGYKIKKCYYAMLASPFKGYFNKYIDTFYKLKKENKQNLVYKLLLNSLYGKFAQKIDEQEINYELIAKNEIIDNEKIYLLDNMPYKKVVNNKGHSAPKFHRMAYPIIASYITAQARLYLFETMERLGLKNIIYCDTDSLTVNLSLKDIQKKINISNELGAWAHEWEGEFQARGLKYYKYRPNKTKKYKDWKDWQYKIKGIPNKGDNKKNFWNNRKVNIKKPNKFKACIISKGTKQLNKWEPFTIRDNLPMPKRFKLEDGSTRNYKNIKEVYEHIKLKT